MIFFLNLILSSFIKMELTYSMCKFKGYNVMIWYLYILQNGHHNKVS